jgi:hypothetical protein
MAGGDKKTSKDAKHAPKAKAAKAATLTETVEVIDNTPAFHYTQLLQEWTDPKGPKQIEFRAINLTQYTYVRPRKDAGVQLIMM